MNWVHGLVYRPESKRIRKHNVGNEEAKLSLKWAMETPKVVGSETSMLRTTPDHRFTEGSEVSSLSSFILKKAPVLNYVTWWIGPRAKVLLEGLGKLRNQITLSGIEFVTFLPVAYYLSWLRYRVPQYCLIRYINHKAFH
jgi:hypothetical protein